MVASCSLLSTIPSVALETQKIIKLGDARVKVVCHGDVPQHIEGLIGVSSVFDRSFESTDINLVNEGDTLSGTIAIETPQALGAMMLSADGQTCAVGYVELSQTEPLQIDVTFKDGKVTNVQRSNANGFNALPMMTSEEDQNVMFTSAGLIVASPNSWRSPGQPKLLPEDFSTSATAKEKLDSLRAYIINEAIGGRDIPAPFGKWFMTHLNNMVYCGYYLGYADNFDTGGRTLSPDFFDFLSEIDFTQLYTHDVMTGPNYMMRKLLASPDLGMEPIKETSVSEWQAMAKAKLGEHMPSVPQMLLDLLSATSYSEQLKENKPFSPTQIQNIKAGYSDDLGLLLLKMNDSLVADLGKQTNMADLSDTDFNLQAYIDANYPGRPVVVDSWNTWCMPCLEAHKKIEPIREMPVSQGVEYLYVSDTTSPLTQWQRLVPRIGGDHVRINEASRNAMGTTYSLEGFPSYLFFDADHTLRRIVTAYPGNDDFILYLQEINTPQN